MVSKKNHSIEEALMSDQDLCELDTTELAQVMGGGPVLKATAAVCKWATSGGAVAAVVKTFVAAPLIATMGAASALEALLGF